MSGFMDALPPRELSSQRQIESFSSDGMLNTSYKYVDEAAYRVFALFLEVVPDEQPAHGHSHPLIYVLHTFLPSYLVSGNPLVKTNNLIEHSPYKRHLSNTS